MSEYGGCLMRVFVSHTDAFSLRQLSTQTHSPTRLDWIGLGLGSFRFLWLSGPPARLAYFACRLWLSSCPPAFPFFQSQVIDPFLSPASGAGACLPTHMRGERRVSSLTVTYLTPLLIPLAFSSLPSDAHLSFHPPSFSLPIRLALFITFPHPPLRSCSLSPIDPSPRFSTARTHSRA